MTPDMLVASADHERHITLGWCGESPLQCRSCLINLACMIAERLHFDERDARQHPLDWYQVIAGCDSGTAFYIRKRTVEACQLPPISANDLDGYPPPTFVGSCVFVAAFQLAAAGEGVLRVWRGLHRLAGSAGIKAGVDLVFILLIGAEIMLGLIGLVVLS